MLTFSYSLDVCTHTEFIEVPIVHKYIGAISDSQQLTPRQRDISILVGCLRMAHALTTTYLMVVANVIINVHGETH